MNGRETTACSSFLVQSFTDWTRQTNAGQAPRPSHTQDGRSSSFPSYAIRCPFLSAKPRLALELRTLDLPSGGHLLDHRQLLFLQVLLLSTAATAAAATLAEVAGRDKLGQGPAGTRQKHVHARTRKQKREE